MTIKLHAEGGKWVELREQEDGRYLLLSLRNGNVVLQKWYRRLEKAVGDFADLVDVSADDFRDFLNREIRKEVKK